MYLCEFLYAWWVGGVNVRCEHRDMLGGWEVGRQWLGKNRGVNTRCEYGCEQV